MQYLQLGNTGLNVSRIGLGLAALGRPGYINLGHGVDLSYEYKVSEMEKRTHQMLDLALSLGIRYFDAAQSYGKAEIFLSNWLKKQSMSRDEINVGSKWGYTYTAEWQVDAEVHEVKSHTPEVFDRQWPESNSRLGDYLRLYQIHSATFESGVLDNISVLSRLAGIKEAGMLIGLSLSGADQPKVLAKAMRINIDGTRLFDCVQATWNLLEPSAGPQLELAAQEGMGIILKEVLANGRLTAKNTDPEFGTQKQLLSEYAQKAGTDIDAWAIAAAMAQPWAHIILSGAAREDHLRSNLDALGIQRSLYDTEWEKRLRENTVQYWKNRKSLAWN